MQAPAPLSRGAVTLALVAAIVASIGDFGLLFAAHAADPSLGFPLPPAATLPVSQWLGTFAIPLYACGYGSLAKGLPGRARPVVTWLGFYVSALGGVVHALTGFAIRAAQRVSAEPRGAFAIPPDFQPYLLPFVFVVVFGFLLASLAFAAGVVPGRSVYPRWLGALNPLVCVLLVALGGATFESGRLFLVPMAPNVGNAVFFGLALCAMSGARQPAPAPR